MLRSWFKGVGVGLVVTAVAASSVLELHPIGPMVRSIRRGVDPCALYFVPELWADKAVIQSQSATGGAAWRIGPPGDAAVIVGPFSCNRPAIDETVQMLYLTVDRIEGADHSLEFLAFGLAVEITHHDCFVGHGWLGLTVRPVETDEILVPVHDVDARIARPDTPVQPCAPVPCE